MDCNVSVDGGDPILVRAGKAHRFTSGLGQHIVQAESLNGTVKDEQSVDQKEPQVVVEVNLSAKQAEEQRRQSAVAEANRHISELLDNLAGNWICYWEGYVRGFKGVYMDRDLNIRHGHEAKLHETIAWKMTLTRGGQGLEGSLQRIFGMRLISGEEYNSFTWNGQEVTSARYTLYYTAQGSLSPNGQIALDAIYERCSGDCPENISNDPHSEDLKGGVAEVRGPGELAWTGRTFDPKTKVFTKDQ